MSKSSGDDGGLFGGENDDPRSHAEAFANSTGILPENFEINMDSKDGGIAVERRIHDRKSRNSIQ